MKNRYKALTLFEVILAISLFTFLSIFTFLIFKQTTYSYTKAKAQVGLQGELTILNRVMKKDLYNASFSSILIQENRGINVSLVGKTFNVSRDNIGFAVRDDITPDFNILYLGYVYYFSTKDSLGNMYRILSSRDSSDPLKCIGTYHRFLPQKADINDFNKFPSGSSGDNIALLSSHLLKTYFDLSNNDLSVYIVLVKPLSKKLLKFSVKYNFTLFDF